MSSIDYRLHHGDCLDILPTLAAGSVDAIIADPPYGTTACKWDSVIPLEPMWAELKRVIKPKGAIVLFAAQPFTSALVMSNAEWFKYEWIWRKSRATDYLSAKNKPMRAHENIVVFSPGTIANKSERLMNYYPQGLVSNPRIERRPGRKISRINGDRPCMVPEYKTEFENYPKSVIEFGNPNHGALHPTQKPVDLLRYLIRTYTNEGETVLDFTMGSGTTGVACMMEGRKFIGMELDAGYFDIAKRRIGEAVAEQTFGLFAQAAD